MVTRADAHKPDFPRDDAWKQPVRCATTAPVTIATALNAGDAIDGVTLAAGCDDGYRRVDPLSCRC